MLARRFTIVCLMTALFGMGLANLVAHSEQSQRRWPAGKIVSCAFEQGVSCSNSFR